MSHSHHRTSITSTSAALVLATIGLTSGLQTVPARAADTDPVTFADPDLQSAINAEIDSSRPSDAPITEAQARALTSLDASYLYIDDCTGIEHLTNLTTLNLSGNEITDISLLAALTSLTTLNLRNNEISDVAPLRSLRLVTSLNLGQNEIADASPLSELRNLSTLDLYSNPVRDVGPFASLSHLTSLNLGRTQVRDLTPLAGLSNLSSLSLPRNEITEISSLTGLRNLTQLTNLNLNFNQIKYPDIPETLTNLEGLGLVANSISDVTPIAHLTELTSVDMEYNNISDVSPLASLSRLEWLGISNQTVVVSRAGVEQPVLNPVVDASGNPVEVTSTDPDFTYDTSGNYWSFSTPGEDRKIAWNTTVSVGSWTGPFNGTITQEITTERVPTFSDVPATYLFAPEIGWLAQSGITNGYDDGTFRPRNSISREAMAAFLYRYAGEPTYSPPAISPFADVPTTYPFYAEISWLAHQHITTGYNDGTFRPRNPISREAMAAFLYRYQNPSSYAPDTTSEFTDVPTDYVFYNEISWLADQHITNGYSDGTFRPRNQISREATAAFLYRLHSL